MNERVQALIRARGLLAVARALAHMMRGFVNSSGSIAERKEALRMLKGYLTATKSGVTPGMLELWFARAGQFQERREQLQKYRAGGVGFEPLQFWTPAEALARIEQIDAKVKMLGIDVAASAAKVGKEYVDQWAVWVSKWNGYAADLRDSWFSRGFVATADQLDAYERELDALRTRFVAAGGVLHGANLNAAVSKPEDPAAGMGKGLEEFALAALGIAAVALVLKNRGK